MAIIKDSTDIDNIQFLLDYCSKRPELYNEVANHLYERFHMRSAEISLLVTYYVSEERRRSSTSTEINEKVIPEWMRRIDNG